MAKFFFSLLLGLIAGLAYYTYRVNLDRETHYICQFERMSGQMFFVDHYELSKNDSLILVVRDDRTFMLRRDSIFACSKLDH
jgi:hypothetical protein